MALQSFHQTALTKDLMESSEQNAQDDAFPRATTTETPELDYLSDTSESDFPQVSLSKRGGMMLRGGTMSKAKAKRARKEATRTSSGTQSAAPFLQPVHKVMERIRNHPGFRASEYIVGYHDRHDGIMEKAFEDWSFGGVEDEDFIPTHRIERIRRTDGHIVWDRTRRIDEIYRTGITSLEEAA
ncbi:MAG: hypothetical protein Q9220_001867 [cf. Caloplaca sp. 1 TL-2023]